MTEGIPFFKGDVGIYYRRNFSVFLYIVAVLVLVPLSFFFGQSMFYLFFPMATLFIVLFILATASDKYVVCFYDNAMIYQKGKTTKRYTINPLKKLNPLGQKQVGYSFYASMTTILFAFV